MDRPSAVRPYPLVSTSSYLSNPRKSSSSLASIPSPSIMTSSDQAESLPAEQSAPLPSPTNDQRGFFFAHLSPPPAAPTLAATAVSLPPQQQPPPPQQQAFVPNSQTQPGGQGQDQSGSLHQQSDVTQHTQSTWGYAPNRENAGSTNPETVKMLHEYNLLAEAAKRAQVACMIRDMDAMDMS